MPRSPRIQFEGAVYHVLARGNRREPIVLDDQDRCTFVDTLGEACAKTGWEIFGWTLMNNHYHLALRTPEANLVAGMIWFQNTFTRRFNARHRTWGHQISFVAPRGGEMEKNGETCRLTPFTRVLLDFNELL